MHSLTKELNTDLGIFRRIRCVNGIFGLSLSSGSPNHRIRPNNPERSTGLRKYCRIVTTPPPRLSFVYSAERDVNLLSRDRNPRGLHRSQLAPRESRRRYEIFRGAKCEARDVVVLPLFTMISWRCSDTVIFMRNDVYRNCTSGRIERTKFPWRVPLLITSW